MWRSFDIFVVTCRVTNFLPKLLDMLLFSTLNFHFLFSPIFGCCPLDLLIVSRWCGDLFLSIGQWKTASLGHCSQGLSFCGGRLLRIRSDTTRIVTENAMKKILSRVAARSCHSLWRILVVLSLLLHELLLSLASTRTASFLSPVMRSLSSW